MFKEPTVFILGAGASWHYGYPTGEELIRKLTQKIEIVSKKYLENGHPIFYDRFWPRIIQERKNLPDRSQIPDRNAPQYIEEFKNECKNFSDDLRDVNPLVIDYFLGSNPRHKEIGKFFIAWIILECEQEYERTKANQNRKLVLKESPFIEDRNRSKDLDLSKYNDDWIRLIVHKLAESNILNSPENKIKFVTFNYDLSLERKLFQALKKIEIFSSKDIQEFICEDRFIHMYGKIGENFQEAYSTLNIVESKPDLPLAGGYYDREASAREQLKAQKANNLFNAIYESSKSIRTIERFEEDHCDKVNQVVIKKAQDAISDAEKVFILGYGFDAENNKRIGLEELKNTRVKKRSIYFTNFGDKNLISKRAGKIFGDQPEIFLPPNYIYHPNKNKSYYEKSIRNVYDALERDFDFL